MKLYLLFSSLKHWYNLPATIVMIVVVICYMYFDFYPKTKTRFSFWRNKKKTINKMLDSTEPFEYTFSTIFWGLLFVLIFK